MSNLFRYLIAGTTAILLILGPLAWAVQFGRSIRADIAKRIRANPNLHIHDSTASSSDEELLLAGAGFELSAREMNQILLADLLVKFWWIWALAARGISC